LTGEELFDFKSLLAEASEDNVGLWELAAYARGALREGTTSDVLAMVLDILGPLLLGGLMEAGGYSGPGSPFERWDFTPQAALGQVEAFWNGLGREPRLGDNVYFVATPLGRRWLTLLK
jgi:hypothetical protein